METMPFTYHWEVQLQWLPYTAAGFNGLKKPQTTPLPQNQKTPQTNAKETKTQLLHIVSISATHQTACMEEWTDF